MEGIKVKSSKMADAIIDFLINIPLFDSLKGKELDILAANMKFIELRKGDILFEEGEKGDYVCFVVDGILDVMKSTESGKRVVLTDLQKNRSIGEMAVIDDFPRSATVKARKNSTLVILTRQGFDAILKEHSEIGVKILKGLARLLSMNLRKTSSRLADYMLPIG